MPVQHQNTKSQNTLVGVELSQTFSQQKTEEESRVCEKQNTAKG